MSSLNRIVLVGTVANQPQSKSIAEGNTMATFTMAVERPLRFDGTASETDFIDVVAWRHQAELVIEQFTKGTLAVVEGRIQVRTQDDSSGKRTWITEVVASGLRALGVNEKTPAMQTAATEEYLTSSEPVMAEEDIPF